ncbi:unnamed protein product [Eruca vesicaria subsp. sativa]|uniref:Serine-threonine/tyrosine-protein kinase catalytic domain-containing protein n=1 Tax=Eruca vesicaria subsp. sativa TaxID=29727 RepID=A0ABC8LL91_ERUVS|nr:unnamed protein product [Eruca vesicaria subsp. sativa]
MSNKQNLSEKMDDIKIAIVEVIIFFMIVCCCRCCCTGSTELPPELIDQTPQPQQDIETGHTKGLLFRDIKKEEEEEEEEGCDKRCCPICLEEYEDDHEIRRLEKYLSDGCATSKSDVCAFGVVLFEIVSGREAVIRTEAVGTKNPERRPLASILITQTNYFR